MNKGQDILKELNEMGSKLAGITREMPFAVPDNYFSHLPDEILLMINDSSVEDNIPDKWSRNMPFDVPSGYFDGFPDSMTAAATSGNIIAGSPASPPFSIPNGYFENLPGQLLKAAKAGDIPPRENKTIKLPVYRSFRAVQWAAAAMFILFIGIGSYITFFSDRIVAPDTILVSVSNKDIQDYLQHTYNIDVDNIYKNDINNLQLDNKDIIEYLNETGWDVVE